MLYLNPPFYVINGVALLPDHADPLQWYYLPLAPHISIAPAADGGPPVPQLQLIEFRGDAGSGGFLNFDVNTGASQAQLDAIAGKLQGLANLGDTPRLGAATVIDGSVRLMLFGTESGTPATPPAPAHPGGTAAAPPSPITETTTGKPFVTRIDQAAKPSLYGDEQAVFSVQLDADGAVLMDAALHGRLTPIGVVYQLDLLALRPAYAVTLSIDWERVQHQLDNDFSSSSIFASSDIDNAVDKLIESQAIKLQVDSFTTPDEDPTVITDKDKAVAEVREMITSAFFKPSIDPSHPQPDGWDKAAAFGNRISQLAVTGGLASLASFTYHSTDYTRLDTKLLNVSMRERSAVRRSIYPQGLLTGLAAELTAAGTTVDSVISKVDLSDPWFARRTVQVVPVADYARDGIESLNVTLTYGGEPKNVIFGPTTAPTGLSWASTLTAGAMVRDVTVQYTVTFQTVDGLTRPPELTSQPRSFVGDSVQIDPRELYAVTHVPVTALGVPWEQWSSVEVDLRYSDPANAIEQTAHLVLDQKNQAAPQPWAMFQRDPAQRQFSYRLTYHGAADRPDYQGDWTDTTDGQVTVRDPFGRRLDVMVVPDFNWQQVDRAFVDVEYSDAANSVDYQQTYEFTEHKADTQTFTVELRDPNLRRVAFDATVLMKDGSQITVPRSYTLKPLLVLRSDLKGHQVILVEAAASDLGRVGLSDITVELTYADGAHALSFSGSVVLSATAPQGAFEYDFVDPAALTYSWRATYRYADGLSRTSDWAQSSADVLSIPVS